VESPTNNIIRSERRERLSFYDKLSTVGGILGLCNGMSALSIAECLLMICSLFYALLRIVGKRLNFICKTEKLNTTDSAEFKNDDDESDDESDEDLWLQLVELHVSLIFIIFKLADRMRSMRTNGASKNRDYSDANGTYFPLFSI
jgi:hypothetical protein